MFGLVVAVSLLVQSSGPALNSISPNAVRAGSTSVTITLTGSDFTSSSVVIVDGESLPTTFVNSTTLRCLIPDNKLARPAALPVLVFNSDSSRTSQSLVFSVYSPSAPTVTSINPVAGFRGTTMSVGITGTNLVGAALAFSGSGITAVSQAGTTTTFNAQVSIAADAPFGLQSVTISTPSGSTTMCGQTACAFSVVEPGSWTLTGPLHDTRSNATIVRLVDGQVLIAGGASPTSGGQTATAEIFNPLTGQWTPTSSMSVARRFAPGTLLPDGRVLVVSGVNASSWLSSAEIYDPATGAWSITGFMAGALPTFNALLLTTGKVLVLHTAGGAGAPKAELFDPVAGRFEPVEGTGQSTVSIALALLTNGKVLIADAGTNNRIWDPLTATSTAASPTEYSRDGTWVRLLPDGRVLVRGLYDFGRNMGNVSASLYNPEMNTVIRASGTAVGGDALLPSGSVLIGGGRDYRVLSTSPILYDPTSDSITPMPDPNISRLSPSALLLDDGRVLVIGADRNNQSVSAEIYRPVASSNPAPAISSVTASNPISDSDFISLDVRGSAFLPNSSIELGSSRLVTIYLGSRRLVAFVTPAQRASLSSAGIRAVNPAPGGGGSDPVRVGFLAPPPVITSITPNSAAVGTEFAALVSGQNLSSAIAVNFSGTGVSAAIQPGSGSGSIILNIRVAGDAALGVRAMTIVTTSGNFTFQDVLFVQRASAPVTAPLPIAEVETGAIKSGYVVVTPDAGNTAPISTLTYGIVRGGIAQSQAAILPTALTTDSSFQVDVVQPIGRNLGLAVANVGGTAASIVLTLRYDDGTASAAPVSITIQGRQQLARFITELFPAGAIGAAFRGNLNIQSSVPVSMIGLRFSGIEFSTLPISGTAASAGIPSRTLTAGAIPDTPQDGTVGGGGAGMFPQFAMSGGWATTIGLVNTTPSTITGRVDVFDTSGNPMAVTLNGSTKSTFRYAIPARGSFTLAPRDANGQSPF